MSCDNQSGNDFLGYVMLSEAKHLRAAYQDRPSSMRMPTSPKPLPFPSRWTISVSGAQMLRFTQHDRVQSSLSMGFTGERRADASLHSIPLANAFLWRNEN